MEASSLAERCLVGVFCAERPQGTCYDLSDVATKLNAVPFSVPQMLMKPCHVIFDATHDPGQRRA